MEYKTLIVMPEICCSGIFNEDLIPIDFNEIELPNTLKEELKSWVIFYDNDCHTPRHFQFKKEMANELNKRGRNLAKKIKALYPEIRVLYRGEIDGDMLDYEEITGV